MRELPSKLTPPQNVGKIEKVAAASKVVATCPEAVEAGHAI
jgi:hypothetical protein